MPAAANRIRLRDGVSVSSMSRCRSRIVAPVSVASISASGTSSRSGGGSPSAASPAACAARMNPARSWRNASPVISSSSQTTSAGAEAIEPSCSRIPEAFG